MSGCSRMKEFSTTRSKSLDFSDIPFLPKPPKLTHDYNTNPPDSKIKQNNNIPDKNIDIHAPIQEDENEDNIGEIFGVILSRKCSVSSISSHNNFMSEKETASLQSAVKRVHSMKRSSSVSEGYCRIHNQCDPTAVDEDESVTQTALKTGSIKRKGKIFRTCRRIFGF